MSVGAAEGFHTFQLSKRNLFIENFLSQKSAQKKNSPGPAGPATAGPINPEPTIKNIIPLFVIKQIKNFYIIAAYLYHFNNGIALLYYRKSKIPIFFKQHLRYKLGACKNNSRSLRVKLNNRFPRRFLLMSCHQVPRVHLKNLLKFKFFKFLK